MGTANRTASTAIVLKSEYIFLKKYDFSFLCKCQCEQLLFQSRKHHLKQRYANYINKTGSISSKIKFKQKFKRFKAIQKLIDRLSPSFISLKAFISSDTRKYTNKRTSTNKQNYSTKHSWSLDVPRNPREGSLFFTIELFSLFPVGFSRQGYKRADSDVHWKLS